MTMPDFGNNGRRTIDPLADMHSGRTTRQDQVADELANARVSKKTYGKLMEQAGRQEAAR
jgi:O6-methylguanine-DNA--protein-cysteine methyltransferase